MTFLFCALLALPGAEPGPGRVWPAFRGAGDSRTAAKDLPLTWDDSENVPWKLDLPGYGQSSPVVWNQRIFVTSVSGDLKDQLHLLCFDLFTGKELWRKDFKGTQKVKNTGYVSKAAPTPAVDAQRVYALFESGDLFALDHDGKQLWQRSLVGDYGEFKNNHGLGSSLALCEEAVVALVAQQEGSYLLALEPATGKNRWKVDRPLQPSWTSPIVVERAGQRSILVSSNGIVESFAAADGKSQWSLNGLTGNTVASASTSGDVAVIGSSEKDSFLAVKLDGTGKVNDTHVAWRSAEATCSFGSPLVLGDRVYTVDRAGTAYCVDLKTGQTLWTLRLSASCWASPLGAGDRVYFFATDGKTTVVKAGPQLEKLAENTLSVGDRVYGVAAVDGVILVRTGTQLIRIGQLK